MNYNPIADTIAHLSHDRAFGIYTRQAFELKLTECESDAMLYVIDFNNIHDLNKKLGYEGVNKIIRNVFEELRLNYFHNEVVFGRVFSGDEIAILVKNGQHKEVLLKLITICRDWGLGFKYISSAISSYLKLYQTITILDKLSNDLLIEPQYSKVQ